MKKYTMTWKARFPLRGYSERTCRWTIGFLEIFVDFLEPSRRSPFTFFGCSPHSFRLTFNGRLVARSATYQGV